MAFIQCGFHSDVLGRACAMNVILPQKVKTQIGMTSSGSGRKDYPVVYLLHGLSDDHTIWSRRSSIERYAAEYEVAVVMPNGERGFYTDMVEGYRYWTMLSEELPEIVCNLFPVSPRREDTFAAGLSMGGYGALKLALRRPDRYAGAVGLSSVTDIRARMESADWKTMGRELNNIFGSASDLIPRGNDLFELAAKAVNAPETPRILTVCGTEDFLYQDNLRFRDHMRELNFPNYEYLEAPGAHQWSFWDLHIQYGLKFLLENR
ncbi:alpha/beta hydrolase [Victivallis vadensis]|jgi:putative esterase|uniref:Esterase family protein n=1 Tax=Victivallis vadensis TaxID=172901 RepID=A0A848B8I7_9BACT|nr:alpha/beta hydrolase family protein [Victivallis vadensis]NMD89066.1 esterase family protein [Victivallis vadensis]